MRILILFIMASLGLAACDGLPKTFMPSRVPDSTPAATQAAASADTHIAGAGLEIRAAATQIQAGLNYLATLVTTRPADTQPLTAALTTALADDSKAAAEIGAARSSEAAAIAALNQMAKERAQMATAAAAQHAADAKTIADYKDGLRQKLTYGAFGLITLGVLALVASFFSVFGASMAGARPLAAATVVAGICLWGLATYLAFVWWALVGAAALALAAYVATHWASIQKEISTGGAK